MPNSATVIETDIPARLDRLPWTRFHTLVVVALGITWVLDGLEVTVAGSIAGALQEVFNPLWRALNGLGCNGRHEASP